MFMDLGKKSRIHLAFTFGIAAHGDLLITLHHRIGRGQAGMFLQDLTLG